MSTRNDFNHLFVLYVTIASVVFILICCLLAFAVIRYRAGRGHEPSEKTDHKLLESTAAVLLIGVASFLAVTAANANAQERNHIGAAQLHVRVTGFQWCWKFFYPSAGVLVKGNCTEHIPTVVVPTGEVISFSLTSADVVHEWWLPYADYKEEAFPHHYNFFRLRFDHPGRWEGRCSEFCGLYHDRMEFYLKAVSPPRFHRWLAAHTGGGAKR